jgi:hypothetical protein
MPEPYTMKISGGMHCSNGNSDTNEPIWQVPLQNPSRTAPLPPTSHCQPGPLAQRSTRASNGYFHSPQSALPRHNSASQRATISGSRSKKKKRQAFFPAAVESPPAPPRWLARSTRPRGTRGSTRRSSSSSTATRAGRRPSRRQVSTRPSRPFQRMPSP